MRDISIITLSPDRWEDYKAIRIAGHISDPAAFGKSLEEENAYPPERWQDRLREVERGESYLFFAEIEDDIVGIVGAFFPINEPGVAMVVAVYVRPEFRKQGIASALPMHLIEVLKSDPRTKLIKLAANVEQKEAVALYKKLGFQVVGTMRNKMGDGKEHDEYVMELPFRS